MQTKLLINGSLVPGEGQSENVLDPATGKPIAQVAEASGAQVEAAVAAAEGAFGAWSRAPPEGPGRPVAEAGRSHRERRSGVCRARVAQYRQAGRGDAER